MYNDACNRCLVVIDSRMLIRAQFKRGDKLEFVFPHDLSVKGLSEWYERVMEASGGDALFEVNQSNNAFIPISTWNGDPVCAMHLYWLADRELKGR